MKCLGVLLVENKNMPSMVLKKRKLFKHILRSIMLLIVLCVGWIFYEKMPVFLYIFSKSDSWRQCLEMTYFKVIDKSNTYELLRRAYDTFQVSRQGVIHIGARYAEELKYYQHFGIPAVLWVEADPEAEEPLRRLVAKHSGSQVAMFAASDYNGLITLHQTTNAGASSSVLPLKEHLKYHPNVKEQKSIKVIAQRMDDYLTSDQRKRYNVVVIDIQGAELLALKGAIETLKGIDAIVAETNYDELYEGGVFISDLDSFLQAQGFTRVDAMSTSFFAGDALYVKNAFFKKTPYQ